MREHLQSMGRAPMRYDAVGNARQARFGSPVGHADLLGTQPAASPMDLGHPRRSLLLAAGDPYRARWSCWREAAGVQTKREDRSPRWAEFPARPASEGRELQPISLAGCCFVLLIPSLIRQLFREYLPPLPHCSRALRSPSPVVKLPRFRVDSSNPNSPASTLFLCAWRLSHTA